MGRSLRVQNSGYGTEDGPLLLLPSWPGLSRPSTWAASHCDTRVRRRYSHSVFQRSARQLIGKRSATSAALSDHHDVDGRDFARP